MKKAILFSYGSFAVLTSYGERLRLRGADTMVVDIPLPHGGQRTARPVSIASRNWMEIQRCFFDSLLGRESVSLGDHPRGRGKRSGNPIEAGLNRHGNRYFLSQVWTAGSSAERQTPDIATRKEMPQWLATRRKAKLRWLPPVNRQGRDLTPTQWHSSDPEPEPQLRLPLYFRTYFFRAARRAL